MIRFFWVCLPDGKITIAEYDAMFDVYDVPGSEEGYSVEELAIGSEISFSKTGLLAALNDVK